MVVDEKWKINCIAGYEWDPDEKECIKCPDGKFSGDPDDENDWDKKCKFCGVGEISNKTEGADGCIRVTPLPLDSDAIERWYGCGNLDEEKIEEDMFGIRRCVKCVNNGGTGTGIGCPRSQYPP